MVELNIGLIGFGVVGSGVYSLLKKNKGLVRERTGIDIRIKTVCDLRISEIKAKVKNTNFTSDWKDVINDPEIETVIELIGGIEPAKTIVLDALKKGKNVVTANKKLLAEDGEEIYKVLNSSNASLGFEASVGGGMPCVQALKDGLVGNSVNSIAGILNGTTNYILTRMEDDNLSFKDALKDAQKKGFAEADPTFDIEGYDAAHKTAIISRLAFSKKIKFESVSVEGITKISREDILYAKELGFIIKLLGVGKVENNELEVSVHPAMLDFKHPLASVRNEFNAIMFSGDMTGPIILYGKGAGSLPTASAVISDVVRIAQKGNIYRERLISDNAKFIRSSDRIHRYYMRLSTADRPGILSKIAGVLGKHNISIAQVLQKAENAKYVPVIIMTHKCSEKDMLQSIKEINSFDFIEYEITTIRIEE